MVHSGRLVSDLGNVLTIYVIKLYYLGKYHGMAVNYNVKAFITWPLASIFEYGSNIDYRSNFNIKYHSNLPWNYNPIKYRYSGKLPQYFITWASGQQVSMQSNCMSTIVALLQ